MKEILESIETGVYLKDCNNIKEALEKFFKLVSTEHFDFGSIERVDYDSDFLDRIIVYTKNSEYVIRLWDIEERKRYKFLYIRYSLFVDEE